MRSVYRQDVETIEGRFGIVMRIAQRFKGRDSGGVSCLSSNLIVVVPDEAGVQWDGRLASDGW